MDTVIGELVSRMGPEARVFIVSDHGMIPDKTEIEEFKDAIPSSGHHWEAPSGVIIAAGPGIPNMPLTSEDIAGLARSDLQTLASVLDITPTLLALMGIPAGEDMDGRVAEQLIEPTYLKRIPLRTRSTHDNDAWLEERATASATSPNEAERIEQLRSLGYLE
jgi:arylsulfatase A-like enzyme